MSEEQDLFSAPPEDGAPYQVPGLVDHGLAMRGDWFHFWAVAPRALHSMQDRGAIMRLQGYDPENFKIYDPSPIVEIGAGVCTWWQAWPNLLTPYSER